MDISIIFATYKRPDILHRTLESFSKLECDAMQWELWVVDNAGDPATEKVCKDWFEKMPIHYLVELQAGKNHALNRALPEVRGELIVLTDDDIIANPDWLVQLWEGAQRWPEHSVFGGRIFADWPGNIPYWGDVHPLNQSLFSLHWPTTEERPYGDGDFLPYGPNMAVRREIFAQGYRFNPEIGPTNATVYRMGSETEFLQRLKDDGFIPVFLPKAEVKHQIRPEQLSPVGLNRRNFRVGLSDVKPDEKPDRTIFGCAPYLWKQLALAIWGRLQGVASGNRVALFEHTCRSWRLRGKIYAQRHHGGAPKDSFLQKRLEVQ